MKQILLYVLIFTLSVVVSTINAQNSITEYLKPLEIGLAGGVMSYEGDVDRPTLFNFKELQPSGGVFIRKHFSNHFAVRGNFLVGKLTGKDGNFTEPAWRKQRAYSFSSTVSELSAQLEWNILGNHRAYSQTSMEESENGRRYTRYTTTFKKTVLPYLFAGAGVITTDPKPIFNAAWDSKYTEARVMKTDVADGQGKKTRLGVHVGGGLSFHLAPNWVLGGELGFHTAFTDYFDGISQTANPSKNDWYIFGGLNMSYRLINTNNDNDGDGVSNRKDACPSMPGPKSNNGCPLEAQKASVKEEPAATAPVVVQETPKSVEVTPVEVVRESVKASPPPPIEAPREEVSIEPERATSPTVEVQKEVVRTEPLVVTSAPASLPMPTKTTGVTLDESEEVTMNYAFQGVQFETAKAIIVPQSYKTLNDIVNILKRYPTYSLKIEGNTDNQGNESANHKLSKRRAEACLNYFVSKGIGAERLKSFGFGSKRPLANNNTLEGRQQNRRVEFKLVKE
jgi:outer membrane protein OmpA-like peptidoglycan-associated protein/opacity protein-like surface antigen